MSAIDKTAQGTAVLEASGNAGAEAQRDIKTKYEQTRRENKEIANRHDK